MELESHAFARFEQLTTELIELAGLVAGGANPLTELQLETAFRYVVLRQRFAPIAHDMDVQVGTASMRWDRYRTVVGLVGAPAAQARQEIAAEYHYRRGRESVQ